jgi:hypothetical protein
MSVTTYPRGHIWLASLDTSRAAARLDPYQRRRLALLAARGVEEAEIDEHGTIHAVLPSGYRTRIRRHGRRWSQAYYGASLAVWVQLVTSVHPTGIGYGIAAAAQVLAHEAWPRTFRRHRRPVGDHAADRIQRVL